MAVSRRLRFEILRRDNHACRYCGASAPDAAITIDHVVPVALGGSDDAANLVAACRDCNSGKSSVPVDAPLVADLANDAMRWSAAMQEAYARTVANLNAREEYLRAFLDCWETYKRSFDAAIESLPNDWERSVAKWHGLGIPIEVCTSAIDSAMTKHGLRGYDAEFRYAAGIIWSTHEDMQRQVAATMSAPDHQTFSRHCSEWCSVHDEEQLVCEQCGQRNCLWLCGFQEGDYAGWSRARSEYSFAIYQHNELVNVVDYAGAEPPF